MSDTRTNPRGDSTDNRTVTLPVVPLTSTVVLPGAVATLALDSDDARRAAARGRQGDGRVLLVPQVEGRYAKVGTVAHVENMGELPDGTVAAILRTVQRAVIRRRRRRRRAVGQAEIVDDPTPTPAQREVTQSCASSWRRSPSCAAPGGCPRSCAPCTSPVRWPTPSTRGATPTDRAQARGARGDRRRRPRLDSCSPGPRTCSPS